MAKASSPGSPGGKPKKDIKKSGEKVTASSKASSPKSGEVKAVKATKESSKSTASSPAKVLSYPARIRSFLHDVRGETRRVTWPTRKQLIASTSAVLVAILILGLYIGLLDWGFRSIAKVLNL